MPRDYDAAKREAKTFLKEIMGEFPDPELADRNLGGLV